MFTINDNFFCKMHHKLFFRVNLFPRSFIKASITIFSLEMFRFTNFVTRCWTKAFTDKRQTYFYMLPGFDIWKSHFSTLSSVILDMYMYIFIYIYIYMYTFWGERITYDLLRVLKIKNIFKINVSKSTN